MLFYFIFQITRSEQMLFWVITLLIQKQDIHIIISILIYYTWDTDKTKCCNGFYIQFRQSFAKETYFYDEKLKNY